MSESANRNNAKRRGCLKSGAAMKEVVSPGSKPIRILAADGHPKLCQAIRDERQMRSRATLRLFAICATLAGCHPGTKRDVEPRIAFTQVPQWSTGDRNEQDVIEGTVRGARKGQQIALYSKCGGSWRLQPLLASPFARILPNKNWGNEVHLGTEYAALLLDPSYLWVAKTPYSRLWDVNSRDWLF